MFRSMVRNLRTLVTSAVLTIAAMALAAPAHAVTLTFGSATNPGGSVNLTGGTLTGSWNLNDIVQGSNTQGCAGCVVSFSATGMSHPTSNIWTFTTGTIQIIQGATTLYSGSLTEVTVAGLAGNTFFLSGGTHVNGTLHNDLQTLFGVTGGLGALFGNFEVSFQGNLTATGFQSTNITGGEVTVAGLSTSSSGAAPEPASLGFLLLAGGVLAAKRRQKPAT